MSPRPLDHFLWSRQLGSSKPKNAIFAQMSTMYAFDGKLKSTNNINIKLSQSLTHSVSHHFFSPNGLKLSGMLKTDVSNYQKNFAGPAITTGEVSNSHFTNHNYDHNVRMNGGEMVASSMYNGVMTMPMGTMWRLLSNRASRQISLQEIFNVNAKSMTLSFSVWQHVFHNLFIIYIYEDFVSMTKKCSIVGKKNKKYFSGDFVLFYSGQKHHKMSC